MTLCASTLSLIISIGEMWDSYIYVLYLLTRQLQIVFMHGWLLLLHRSSFAVELAVFCPICEYGPIRVWDVPYAYTHIGRPYAYGTAFCPILANTIALPSMIS